MFAQMGIYPNVVAHVYIIIMMKTAIMHIIATTITTMITIIIKIIGEYHEKSDH